MKLQTECANAISFLITHHLVYKEQPVSDQEQAINILDALMHLTGSASKFIRTRAFSTLSTLSTYASSSQNVMDQIYRDIKLPSNKVSKQYYDYILQRMQNNLDSFLQTQKTQDIETNYAGLYCLLRIAKDPRDEIIEEAANKLHDFIFKKKGSEVYILYNFLNRKIP